MRFLVMDVGGAIRKLALACGDNPRLLKNSRRERRASEPVRILAVKCFKADSPLANSLSNLVHCRLW